MHSFRPRRRQYRSSEHEGFIPPGGGAFITPTQYIPGTKRAVRFAYSR
jgi:hypothetical protein